MPVINISKTADQIYPQGGAYLVANTDTAAPVYLSRSRQPNKSDAQLPAQGSVELDGSWFASTLDATVTVQLAVFPGGHGWSNPVGVQIALNALGLAKDATVAAVPAGIQTMGAPPYVINLQSYESISQAPGTTTLHTFAANGRLWAAHLSFAVSTGPSYSGGTAQAFAALQLGSGKTLQIIEVAVGGPSNTDSGDADLSIGGLAIADGDTLDLNVNSGTTITGAVQRASCVALVSFP